MLSLRSQAAVQHFMLWLLSKAGERRERDRERQRETEREVGGREREGRQARQPFRCGRFFHPKTGKSKYIDWASLSFRVVFIYVVRAAG